METFLYILAGAVLGTTISALCFFLGVYAVRSSYFYSTSAHFDDIPVEKDKDSNTVEEDAYNWDNYDETIKSYENADQGMNYEN